MAGSNQLNEKDWAMARGPSCVFSPGWSSLCWLHGLVLWGGPSFQEKLLCQATKCWLAQLWVMVWMWTPPHRLVGLNTWPLVGGAVFRGCGMWCLFIAGISGGFWMVPPSLSTHFSLGCIYLSECASCTVDSWLPVLELLLFLPHSEVSTQDVPFEDIVFVYPSHLSTGVELIYSVTA